jgi:hypothetical protein
MITSCVTNAGRLALLKGLVKPEHKFKMALYTSAAKFDTSTKVYTPVDEVQGGGYEAKLLPQPEYGLEGHVAYLDFPGDVIWPYATISADGCMIFDVTLDNLALVVVSFGGTISSTNDEFKVISEARTIRFP